MSDLNSQIPKPEFLTSGSPDEQLALKSLEYDIYQHPSRYQIALGHLGVAGLNEDSRPIGPVDEETSRRITEFTDEPEGRRSLSLVVEYDEATTDKIYSNTHTRDLLTELRKHPHRESVRGRHETPSQLNPEAIRISRRIRIQTFGLFVDMMADWQDKTSNSPASDKLPKAI